MESELHREKKMGKYRKRLYEKYDTMWGRNYGCN